ncbi:olfactory receptor 52K1-like [Phodopus roborovskii]|uniref:olfactory receptor 52K1-like n=1 Tax=Phodopus roborovskii TaxID=109678 RepID=UPI0021E4A8C3|nr:olfactory receptor 52K1-like [Phodopus roborovskii]
MAFDHYVAICKPLHYTTVLTKPLIIKIGLVAVTRAVTLMTPLPFLLRCFHYCRGVMIAHCYCEHMAVVRLACGDTRFNNIYGIAVAHYKAFGTCVSHIGAILSTYTPVVISSVMHRVAHQAAPHVHILLAIFYLLFLPIINPIIYGVKTRQIRDHVLSLFRRKDV